MIHAVVGSLMVASALAAPTTDPHATYQRHLQLIEEHNIKPTQVNATATVSSGKSASSGSFMTRVYETATCSEGSLYTASGYVYNQCIALGDQGSFMYSDCSQTGGKTVVQMTQCTTADCSSGCTTYPLPFATGCQTMSIMTCEDSKEPWKDLGLNSHAEMYYGESSCGGDFDLWSAVNVDEADCTDVDCTSDDSSGTSYAVQVFCDAASVSSGSEKASKTAKAGDESDCADDVGQAAEDITQAGLDINAAVTDCADGFTPKCNNDIDAVLNELTSASEHITAAVYDCSGGEPTPCSEDINNVLADLTGATEAITDAVISCPISDAKCGVDISKAVVDIGKAAADIARAVNDC